MGMYGLDPWTNVLLYGSPFCIELHLYGNTAGSRLGSGFFGRFSVGAVPRASLLEVFRGLTVLLSRRLS